MKTKIFFIFLLSFFIYNVASADSVTIHVRYQDFVAFDGTTTLPDATTTTLDDSSGIPHPISSDSALYLLSLVASSSQDFSLSDLEYYSSFNEFYVNCIDINATSTIHACANWQYAVNGADPSVGSDQYVATSSDDIYFYFGNQRQFFVSATSTDTVTPIVVTAQKYDYTDNAWLPLSGEVVDATQPNPNDEWNPFIIASSTSDTSGTASLLLTNAGVYDIGLSDDGFYPTEITVATATIATSTVSAPTSSGGGSSSGGSSIVHHTVNVDNAFDFLEANQNQDGSFSSSLYTDWAAIAFAAGPENSYESKIKNYELSVSPNTFSNATDFERHAMALEALGINPYTGTETNYIQDIVNQFDGTQIGDPNLINDDIFSIFPLIKAGYSSSDIIIQKVVANIISKQNSDGSWGDSVDLTAAAIQALKLVSSLPNINQSIAEARTYLVGQQEFDGGFGSSDSTSWALQAISALGESGTNWLDGINNPYDYLYNLQQSDGGIEINSEDMNARIWATEYAIPAALGKPWASILNSFSKPTVSSVVQSGNISSLSASANVFVPAATTSVAKILVSTTTTVNFGARKTGIGEHVVGAKRTSESIPVFPALATSSQAAAVIMNQGTTTVPIYTRKTIIALGSSVVIVGICLLIFI